MSDRPPFIEINTRLDREGFLSKEALVFLSDLTADARPMWGMMRGQHMVEHLVYIMEFNTGVREIPLLIPEEKLPKYKAFLMSDYGFTRNFKFPKLPEDSTLPLQHPDMATAVDAYRQGFAAFMTYLNAPSFTTSPHPFYGQMNREEAIMFQYKHHLHHMMQFGYQQGREVK